MKLILQAIKSLIRKCEGGLKGLAATVAELDERFKAYKMEVDKRFASSPKKTVYSTSDDMGLRPLVGGFNYTISGDVSKQILENFHAGFSYVSVGVSTQESDGTYTWRGSVEACGLAYSEFNKAAFFYGFDSQYQVWVEIYDGHAIIRIDEHDLTP